MTEEQTMQYVKIAAKKTLDELGKQYAVRFALTHNTPSVFESKIGGTPYFPSGAEIPLDSHGNQLRFLMQINCSDVQGLDCFPEKGILQFWICGDDCWGMCDRECKGFRVIYYQNVTEAITAPPITAFTDVEKEFFPLHGEFGVAFQPALEDTPKDSIQYQKTFCKYFNELSGENIESVYALRYELHLSSKIMEEAMHTGNYPGGHKIGGSSDFCQYDPRETEEKQANYNFQLLQMVSDFGRIDGKNYTNIMWGDGGICHFFINREKLKNCDFSDILYYCDCC